MLIKADIKDVREYVKGLKKGKSCTELDVILLASFLGAELQIYCLEDNGLVKQTFNVARKKPQGKGRIIRMYLEPNGKFDTIYNKATIKAAGICQSILLDVMLQLILAR